MTWFSRIALPIYVVCVGCIFGVGIQDWYRDRNIKQAFAFVDPNKVKDVTIAESAEPLNALDFKEALVYLQKVHGSLEHFYPVTSEASKCVTVVKREEKSGDYTYVISFSAKRPTVTRTIYGGKTTTGFDETMFSFERDDHPFQFWVSFDKKTGTWSGRDSMGDFGFGTYDVKYHVASIQNVLPIMFAPV